MKIKANKEVCKKCHKDWLVVDETLWNFGIVMCGALGASCTDNTQIECPFRIEHAVEIENVEQKSL